jgi:ABC-type dipeptide/oligopeptide/nickel transport system ATPase component
VKHPLLSVEISVDYPGQPGALRNVALEMVPGEIFGLIGESGAGKSTLALAILRLLDWRGGRVHGRIVFNGALLTDLRDSEMRRVRGRQIALVQQNPLAALNPALRLEAHFREAWSVHQPFLREAWADRLRRLLHSVSLPEDERFLRSYPAQLSVGMAQRVVIALGILHHPSLLIADEPTSALDVITQSEILGLFTRLSRELRIGILFVSHDLLSVASLCSRVAIMRRGEIVETGGVRQIFLDPAHPYTRSLIQALPAAPTLRDENTVAL